MSNIVVLSGSVRNGGNTELLVQAFENGVSHSRYFSSDELDVQNF